MSNPLHEKLARQRILLVSAPSGETQILFRHLQRTRAAVRHLWPAPERIGENADIVLCDYGPGLSQQLAWMPGEPESALIVVLPQNGHYSLEELQSACPDAVLYNPYQLHAVDTALMQALDHFGYGKRQRTRITRMEENVRAIRIIEKAKQAIMANNAVTEADAFQILRNMAMRKRESIAALAAKIVDSVEVLTYKN